MSVLMYNWIQINTKPQCLSIVVVHTDYVAHNITELSAMDELDERTPKEGYKDDCDSDCMEDTVRKELILWTTED